MERVLRRLGLGQHRLTVEHVEQLRTVPEAASVSAEIVRYPHAAHAFALDAAERRYAPCNARDAWQRT
ncbi:MAG: dienelactone hydrolase family protein [Actinobacteria bacterium]|nr:dienelactone hydrolase family protein [Actinomycetota bacterium]